MHEWFDNPERRRSLRYRRIHAIPVIGRATHFFAAAAVVTRVLASRRRTGFLGDLGACLETANRSRAAEILAGTRYAQGSAEENTADFVRYEQQLVQDALEDLRARNAVGYAAVVRAANSEIASACGLLARLRYPLFARAARRARLQLARPIDFGRRADRELLGNLIALECRDARAFNPAAA